MGYMIANLCFWHSVWNIQFFLISLAHINLCSQYKKVINYYSSRTLSLEGHDSTTPLSPLADLVAGPPINVLIFLTSPSYLISLLISLVYPFPIANPHPSKWAQTFRFTHTLSSKQTNKSTLLRLGPILDRLPLKTSGRCARIILMNHWMDVKETQSNNKLSI